MTFCLFLESGGSKQQFFYDMNAKMDDGEGKGKKRKRDDDHGSGPPKPQGSRWFCLSSAIFGKNFVSKGIFTSQTSYIFI